MRLTKKMLEAILGYASVATAQSDDGGDYDSNMVDQAEKVREWAIQKLDKRSAAKKEADRG